MMNPPSCMVGNLPNNLDINLNEAMQPNMLNDFPENLDELERAAMNGVSGQVDMS